MKLQKPFSVQSNLLPALMFVIAWLVSGCSGSSDSDTSDGQPSINSTASESNNSNSHSNENIDTTEAESNTEIAGDEMMLEDELNQTENDSTVITDPQVQNTIPVTFEITVPYILSNELSVELIWGEINLTAMWVGDQFWSATGEFPTKTEHLLKITFYDQFGDIELARYSQVYRVGSNATESVQILAEQFDANPFDNDGDGVNNLDELNAGTNPFVDEDSLLEIRDAFALNYAGNAYSRISVSQTIESLVNQDRPYVDAYETECCISHLNGGYSYKTLHGKFNINIDIDGNGTIEVNTDEPRRRHLPRLSATRINSESSISWIAEYSVNSDFYYFHENITNTVSVVDDNLRSFVQEVTGENLGGYRYSWETSANLTGKLIEGTSLCEPVAGTFTYYRESDYHELNNTIEVTTVGKEIDDPYWRVVSVVEIGDDYSETTEYFARELQILNDPDDDKSAFFKCDFVDF